jgi:branched-chain amino acid transport system permease protein
MTTDILVSGLVTGGMYAILAVGFALIFSVGRIVNMAHTAFYMVAAFLIFIGTSMLKFGLPLSIAGAIIITTLLGIICYKLFFDRVKEHESTVMIISMALAMLLQEILLLKFGGEYRGISSFLEGFVEIGGTRVSYQHLFAIVCTGGILLGLWLWLSRTRIGKAIRAVAQDPEIANLMGIHVSNMYLIVMAVSAGLAGVAGAVMGPINMISPLMWAHPIVIVLASVILGGVGSVAGAVVGAFILGYVETLVVFLIPGGSFLGGPIALCIMVLVLLIRPEGIFGVFFEEERL